MSSAAQRDETTTNHPAAPTDGRSALKQLAAERLAAHRNRRVVTESREAQARRELAEAQAAIRLQARRDAARADGHPDVSRVRDAVAARYQQSVSYGDFLAAEAQRATAKAQAEAEVAARNAKAVAAAQRELLQEIEQWQQAPAPIAEIDLPVLELVAPAESLAAPSFDFSTDFAADFAAESVAPSALTSTQLQVRLPEDVEWTPPSESYRVPSPRVQGAPEELAELDDEIEFRLAPEFHDLVLETQAIPGNIIEFPRELVASRKARPRLAEGPLLADGTPEPQLRIFEVEPEQISMQAEAAALAEAPEWQGLLLGAGPSADPQLNFSRQLEAQLQLDHPIYAAPVARRALAAAADASCIAAGLASFAAVAVKIAGSSLHAMPRPLLGAATAGVFAVFALLYQLLFFSLNDATPGMRMARVAFCTFREGNPSRRALRRRLLSTALAACPLGLGLVWMMLDSDGLGWHDRMSRMYPRSY
jgi:uncharacterized RDD family membrane protein YckC